MVKHLLAYADAFSSDLAKGSRAIVAAKMCWPGIPGYIFALTYWRADGWSYTLQAWADLVARVEWLHQYSMAGVRTGPGSSSASMPCTVIGLCVQRYEFFRGSFANACKPRPTIEYTARMYRTRRALLAHRPVCGRRMRAS